MRVLTYNIAGNRGRGRRDYIEKIARMIREMDADIVGLQEVVHYPHDPHPPEEVLAELTGMHAVYLPAHTGKRHSIGNAVLCRDEIIETVSYELPHTFPERRILLEVDTTARGLPVTVFCTHLVHLAGAGARMRLVQATAVAKRLSTCWRPYVLLGDLNAGPRSRELRPLRDPDGDHSHLDGIHSWPSRRPFILYDHIWPGPGWVVEQTSVLDPHISDHRPLLAQLGWKGSPRFNIMPDEAYLDRSIHSGEPF
ncbi:MAG: Endonuclease/Exonuclease/phosphatase family protein [Armatimonadetes bacterium]|jgi:endonuclease/exonuclease/phosphatase family metal-dependent hydrolase|nr:Endonuclease/Exonuclease/phosphatase family protein [Armatimonadota bacterium]